MSSTITQLKYPFTIEQIAGLKIGMRVSLSGKIFTGRDRLHKYVFEGGELPVSLQNGALYHCGPVMINKDGKWVVRAAGPTTSIREEPYMASIIKQCGLKVIIGKGGMGRDTAKACKEFGCVYLQAVGGTASVLASRILSVDNVYFLKEFGAAEAMWELQVENFEAVVAIDTAGRDLNARIKRLSRKALKEING